ncbi:MAG: hypothetical protein LBR47_02970 [Spirochaetaceae bacterium]|jgi:hypothetical protein|nr:hypothetical protein [Spirochaetaceae bacterium]
MARSVLSRISAVFSVLLIMGSCATYGSYERVDANVYASDFTGAAEALEEDRNYLYSATDSVLYQLDTGILAHYAGDFSRSNERLSEAEAGIYAFFTKSISQTVGAYLVNDSVMDYAGEEYEDIYTNIFMALNYYHLGKMESAFVEIRRFDNKQKALSTKYADALANAREEVRKQGDSSAYPDSGVQFNNSALARYISMLFYRGSGQFDSAGVDHRYIQDAFATQPQLYPFPVPSSVAEELTIPGEKARLNVLAFSGLAPKKEEEVLRVPLTLSGTYYKLSLPVMVDRFSAVNAIQVSMDNGEVFTLELLEDISAIAKDTFKQKQSLIYLRSVIRSLTKTTSSLVMDSVADNADDSGVSLLFSILSLGSKVYNEFSETADLRISRYFPGSAWVGGITLDPGIYSFTVEYFDSNRRVVETRRFENVSVFLNSVNLVEVICLR